MRVLVTGGFGFLGGRLAEYFGKGGHEIVLGTRKALVQPAWLPTAKVVQMNWDDFASMESACQNIDLVLHCAGMNAADCASNPDVALEFNGFKTNTLVHAARRSGVAKFLFFSTVHVYDNPLTGNIDESTAPRNSHPYALSNLAGEQAVLNAEGIDAVVLRCSNAFGWPVSPACECWSLLINDLCRQAISKGVLLLSSDGSQERDFISISNLCNYVDQMLSLGSELYPLLINICSGKAHSVIEIAEMVAQQYKHIYGLTLPVMFEEPKKNNPVEMSRTKKLTFKTDKLKKLGVDVSDDLNDEICALLKFCKIHFEGKL